MAEKWSGAAFTAADVADINATTSSFMGIGATVTDNFKITASKLAQWLRQTGFAVALAVASPAAVAWGFNSGLGTDNPAGAFTLTAPLSTGNALPATLIFRVGVQVAGSSSTLQTAGAALTLSHTTAGGHLGTFAGDVTITGGNLGIGGAVSTAYGVLISGTPTTGSTQVGFGLTSTFSVTGTATGYGFYSGPTTVNSAFTMTNFYGGYIDAVAKGAASTITNRYGLFIVGPTDGATINTALQVNGGVGTVILASSGQSLTGSLATTMVDLAGTWNTSGTPTAFKLAITNTASNAASLLMNLLAGAGGATSMLNLTATGILTIASSMIVPTTYAFAASGAIIASSDGVFRFQDNAGTSFTRFQLGGTTTAFPGLTRNGVNLIVTGASGTAVANIGIGDAAPGTGFVNGLYFGTTQGTSPSTSTDLVHLYGLDISAGNRALAIWAEAAENAAVAVVSTTGIPITYRGTQYRLLATTVMA